MKETRQSIVDDILAVQPVISAMISAEQARFMLQKLQVTIEDGVEGDVVEMGCNRGTSALFFQRMLLALESNKTLHLYDSFEGLPEKHIADMPHSTSSKTHWFRKGGLSVSIEKLQHNFTDAHVPIPVIHKGWFADISDAEYPDHVAFAFFDGDFYSSIIDSFERIYPRLCSGAYVFVHDYTWNELPGARKACDDFLHDKPERGTMTSCHGLGWMQKQ